MIAERLAAVRARIDRACDAEGRDPASVELLAVSKTHPPEAVLEAYAAGQRLFGESYVQDWQGKADDARIAALPDLRWHFIGHLQRNKVRFLLGRVACVETVDRLRLARDLARRSQERGATTGALIQVDVSGEQSKHGFSPGELRAAMPELVGLGGLRLQGLMAIGSWEDDAEATRPQHAALRRLRDELQDAHGVALPTLSTGMSHDLEAAIAEGSTRVRVGTAIFGPRVR